MLVSEREERGARCTLTNSGVVRPIRRAPTRGSGGVAPSRPVSSPVPSARFSGYYVSDCMAVAIVVFPAYDRMTHPDILVLLPLVVFRRLIGESPCWLTMSESKRFVAPLNARRDAVTAGAYNNAVPVHKNTCDAPQKTCNRIANA
jgi:hypothetical protein